MNEAARLWGAAALRPLFIFRMMVLTWIIIRTYLCCLRRAAIFIVTDYEAAVDAMEDSVTALAEERTDCSLSESDRGS